MSANQSRGELEASLIAKAWKNEAFKRELISNPKAVYARELGQLIPETLTIQVLEETPGNIYLVLPKTPQVSEELSEEALEAVAGGGGCVLVTWGMAEAEVAE